MAETTAVTLTTDLIKSVSVRIHTSFRTSDIHADKQKAFKVDEVSFDLASKKGGRTAISTPNFNGEYVLLTPNEIPARDGFWINQGDVLAQFTRVCGAVPAHFCDIRLTSVGVAD